MNAETIVIHYPLYPSKDKEDYVTYFIDKIKGDVNKIILSEMVSDIDKYGNPIIKDEAENYTILDEWNNPVFPINFKKKELHENSKYITYVVEVIGKKNSYNHTISYATQPFPTSDVAILAERLAIPVYIVANRKKAMNCVFIQDIDMYRISNGQVTTQEQDKINEEDERQFYFHVNSLIHNAMHKELFLRRLRNSFNFYLNPVTSDIRTLLTRYPKNHAKLSFSQLKMILHKTNGYSSSEFYEYGTFLHEAGHSFFELQDEYSPGGTHEQLPANYPNNWKSKTDVEKAVGNYKLPKSVIQEKDGFWKICNDNCAMKNSELFLYPFGIACKYAITNAILTRSKYHTINLDDYDINIDEDKIVNKINKHMKKYKYDINYGYHIGFKVKWNINIEKYEIYDVTKRLGGIPYNEIQNNIKSVYYFNVRKETILMSSLPFYLFKDENGDNVIDKSKEFELLMPYDNGIKKIDINVQGNDKIELDLTQYSETFDKLF